MYDLEDGASHRSHHFKPLCMRYPARGTLVNELASLNNVLFPRRREIRRLENLLVEARQNLQEVARKGGGEVDERDDVSDLTKSLAKIKAVTDYFASARGSLLPQAPRPHASGPGPVQ
jgi:hypothetical protein